MIDCFRNVKRIRDARDVLKSHKPSCTTSRSIKVGPVSSAVTLDLHTAYTTWSKAR